MFQFVRRQLVFPTVTSPLWTRLIPSEGITEPTSASNAVVRNRTGSGGPSPSKVFDFESKNIKLTLHSCQ